MKLLLAIVNNDDSNSVSNELKKSEFIVTKIASTGGFLSKGNTTFIIGTQDEDVEKVIEIIGKNAKKRKVSMPPDFAYEPIVFHAGTSQVTVGGATVFVIDVERYEHL